MRGAIRRLFFRWPGRTAALKEFRVLVPSFKKDGSPTAKPGIFYRCATCGVLGKEQVGKVNKKGHVRMWLDHKEPVVPLDRYPDWREYLERLFCDPSNFEVLCTDCHKNKSQAENAIRRVNAKQRRQETNPTSPRGDIPQGDQTSGTQ